MAREFAVIDVETTGFSFRNDRVVEVACLRLDAHFRPVAQFESLVDPERAIPAHATRIHGIVDRDVAGAPTLQQLTPWLRALTSGTTLVAHNAPFDRGFLAFLGERDWLCTVRLARRAFPGAPSYRNQDLRAYLRLDDEPRFAGLGAHRAFADVTVTAEVLRRSMQRIREAA